MGFLYNETLTTEYYHAWKLFEEFRGSGLFYCVIFRKKHSLIQRNVNSKII
jgi:hypothetical protein